MSGPFGPLVQASLGIIAAAAAHVMTFFIAMPSMEKHGPFDLLMKPFDFWRFTIRRLPTGALAIVDVCLGTDRGLFGTRADRRHPLLGDV